MRMYMYIGTTTGVMYIRETTTPIIIGGGILGLGLKVL